ncbi:hypothetical protein KNP414_03712 [Paenibacillus mucilaginosus KNP414]|uniref:Uncharacterized protein n=1 Tax=Paenibacillus mucilaginosus (strain KNP414) TaxID=1036673 RepID=F8FFM3_PAEMK|nr:hypothetical protein KNP414_03712 [Paenibacillus mucilaginosus KNP414]
MIIARPTIFLLYTNMFPLCNNYLKKRKPSVEEGFRTNVMEW